MLRARASPRSSLRPTTATFAPASARPSARAPPSTPVPPITTATSPERSNRFIKLQVDCEGTWIRAKQNVTRVSIIHYSQFTAFSYLRAMEIYDHPTFRMACQQFDLVADHLQLNQSERDRIKYPKRSMTIALPIHCDDGSTRGFTGYSVQHHLTLGSTKGGLRYHPDDISREVAPLAMWRSSKCALAGLHYGGDKGGIDCDPAQLSRAEQER